MCTRFVYRGDNIITGFNFDIDIVEWNHKVINTKDCFYIGIMRPDGMRHSYHICSWKFEWNLSRFKRLYNNCRPSGEVYSGRSQF